MNLCTNLRLMVRQTSVFVNECLCCAIAMISLDAKYCLAKAQFNLFKLDPARCNAR